MGLTGGIASGKSTVDATLERLGAALIDADALVHEALEPGRPEHEAVVAAFGREVVKDDGHIDRRRLGSRIFADASLRTRLNSILHPVVRREEERRKQHLRRQGGGIVITDAALLVETGRYRDYDRLVVVACEPGLQLTRLLARDRDLSAEDARRRLEAQAPVESKLRVADYVIRTDGSLNDTRRRAGHVYGLLLQDLECKRRRQPLPRRDAGAQED